MSKKIDEGGADWVESCGASPGLLSPVLISGTEMIYMYCYILERRIGSASRPPMHPYSRNNSAPGMLFYTYISIEILNMLPRL